MKWIFTTLFLLTILSTNTRAADSLLNKLTRTIALADDYDAAKNAHLKVLHQEWETATDPAAQYQAAGRLYEEYKLFNYDSAYTWVHRLQQSATRLGNADQLTAARLKTVFILLSAGLYKETYDSIQTISVAGGPDSLKADYYTLLARYYFDLASYDYDAYHSVDYDARGTRYLDTALHYYPAGSFDHIYYRGLKAYKEGHAAEAAPFFQQLLRRPDLTPHQVALTTSTLSGFYQSNNDMRAGLDLMIRAAIADIESSTKETFAVFNLASLLFKAGDVKHASLCIDLAVRNADFYGARQRKVQLSSILPLIEGEKINMVESQRRLLMRYAAVVTVLILLLLVLGYIILQQVKRLQVAKQVITDAHARQQEINEKLELVNAQLAEANVKLEEANKIKEESIGYFFNMDAEFFARLDKLKKALEQKLSEKKYDEMRFVVNNIDPRKDKEELLRNFDKVFLKLFPNFVRDMNTLFPPEDQIVLKNGELLNTDLRIFALIRMGITETEKIAQILEYSVKTIYSYKTRLKNKAVVPNEEFEERVMRFRTV